MGWYSPIDRGNAPKITSWKVCTRWGQVIPSSLKLSWNCTIRKSNRWTFSKCFRNWEPAREEVIGSTDTESKIWGRERTNRYRNTGEKAEGKGNPEAVTESSEIPVKERRCCSFRHDESKRGRGKSSVKHSAENGKENHHSGWFNLLISWAQLLSLHNPRNATNKIPWQRSDGLAEKLGTSRKIRQTQSRPAQKQGNSLLTFRAAVSSCAIINKRKDREFVVDSGELPSTCWAGRI